MKFVITVVGALALSLLVSHASLTGAASLHASKGIWVQPALSSPRASAHLTAAQAIAAAKEYAPELFKSTGVTVAAQFGEANLGSLHALGQDGALHSVGTPDVWEVTVSGLNIPRPASLPGNPPPPIHNVSIILNDATGTVLESLWG